MDSRLVMVFLLGMVAGSILVMLFWMSSPGGTTVDIFNERETLERGEVLNTTGGVLVAEDGSGGTIMATGGGGTFATFTDASGQSRDVVCYTSVYCIDRTPCPPCDGECVDLGERCGYWPSQQEQGYLAAAPQDEGTYYGECCEPYFCYGGYCSEEREECVDYGGACRNDSDCCDGYCLDGVCTYEEECVETGETCGMVQDPSIATHVSYVDYGECCPPDECLNNVCTPPEECMDYGEVCGYVANYSDPTHVGETYYGECCEPYECIDNRCGNPEEECKDYGESCGYVSYVTGATQAEEFLGNCCEPYECVNNVCDGSEECTDLGGNCKTDEECCEGYVCTDYVCSNPCADLGETCSEGYVDCCEGGFCVQGICEECKPGGYSCEPGNDECCEGYRCWEFRCTKEETCSDEGDDCSEDGDCCEGLFCYDGVCSEEIECGEEGETCGLGVECCEGLYCSENDECVECAGVGETCGDYAGGLSCCPDAYCYMGICEEKTDRLCEDEEDGPDYYAQGTATGEYNGDYGTYTDYCQDSRTVVDYYCQVNNEYSPVLAGTVTCPNGCSGGACK